MPKPVPVRKMRTCTVFTPHYNEDVTYSEDSLRKIGNDGISLETLLQTLFENDWKNLCQRVRKRGDSSDIVPYSKLKEWASDRGQVLSRTVRGVMLYAEAIRILARLEEVPETEVEALVASKFEYVVTCQTYGQLRTSADLLDRWKANSIDELRHRYPNNLRIAYIDHSPDNAYFSVLLGVDPETREEQVLFKVKLPGDPIVGEGKPENQNHAIIFTRGEHLQTLDMNQDGYLGEALKLRNLLESFKGNIRIVGCREHIFSAAGGALAAFAASSEFVFGTSLQRFMTYPLCVRFHYGHPDVWDKQWALSNGGVSKASRTLHVSEDVFAGFNCVMRGGHVIYQEFMHVGKGRDMSFIGVNGFEQKVSSGNALQCTSRELYRMGKYFDLPRLMSFYFTAAGHFVTCKLTTLAIQLLPLCWLVLALLRAEEFLLFRATTASGDSVLSPEWNTPGPAGAGRRNLAQAVSGVSDTFYFNSSLGFIGQLEKNLDQVRATWPSPQANITSLGEFLGTWTLSTYEESWSFLQLAFFSVLPYILELWVERGFVIALWENCKLALSCSWLFFLFASQTKGYHFASALRQGHAGYIATGRGYVIETGSFVKLYATFATSHIYFGVEGMMHLTLYYMFTTLDNVGGWTVLFYLISMIYSAMLFNPQALSVANIKHSFAELKLWFRHKKVFSLSEEMNLDNWEAWHQRRLKPFRKLSLAQKLRRSVIICILRLSLLVAIASRLETDHDSYASYRSLIVLVSCMLFCVFQLGYYFATSIQMPFVTLITSVGGPSRSIFCILVLAGTIVGYSILLHTLFSPYVVLNGSQAGIQNGFLLFLGGGLASSYVIQMLAMLDSVQPGHSKSFTFRMSMNTYADFWYFWFDWMLAFGLLLTLLCLSLLPLLSLQSQLLFNRNFAKVVSSKLRRTAFLERILS